MLISCHGCAVCRESGQLSPEFYIAEEFLCGPDRSVGNKKDVEVTGCSPMSESLKGLSILTKQPPSTSCSSCPGYSLKTSFFLPCE